MKDQFANYVVQKVLETCDESQRELLLGRIRVHLHALKKYTYGKHIVARVEKLVAAGGEYFLSSWVNARLRRGRDVFFCEICCSCAWPIEVTRWFAARFGATLCLLELVLRAERRSAAYMAHNLAST